MLRVREFVIKAYRSQVSRPGFDPVALDVYDVYIYCNDHGVELKAKAPPLISYAMFWI